MLYVDEKELATFKTMIKETKSRLVANRKKLEQEVKNFRELKKSADEAEAKRIDMLIDDRKQQIAKIRYDHHDYNFPITQVLPVRYGNNLYNYIMLKEIQKKLKGFEVFVSVDSMGVIAVKYRKNNVGLRGMYEIQPLGYFGSFPLRTPVATLES